MRIAVLSYPMLFQTGGGLKMKVGRTVDALKRRGIEASLVDTGREQLRTFDLVHVFAPYNGNHRVVEQARSDGIPVVMSTILNPPFSKWEGRRARLLSRIVGHLTDYVVTTSYQQMVTAMTIADRLIVLGGIERQMLIDGYRMPPGKITTVHNGIGSEFFVATPDMFRDAFEIRHPFVLHTGLICDVKNQLGLVRALKNDAIDIVLVGYCSKENEPYLRACLDEGGERVRYLGELPHGPMIASACAAAALIAIPSRHEGMPNSILEALASDKPVVLTDNHTMDLPLPPTVAREVHADDPRAIGDAVRSLLACPPPRGAARALVSSMSWDRVAEQLDGIYREVLLTRAQRALPTPSPITAERRIGAAS